jgi:CO/xanthine dehydrogenase FAD-binding subunit
MKAAPFEYVRAESFDHALECLSQHGMDAKAIAGGQSLVPMMAMRLARPTVLLDIYRLPELRQVSIEPDRVRMGATTRQRTIEYETDLHEALPLVRDAVRWVGHIQTRNRGTVGGSLVHADPSAELPLAATVLNATLRLQSQADGERRIPAQEFFLGPMFTATGETECLAEIEWPVWQGAVTTAFEETAMRHGDFAMASAACQLQLDEDGICRRAAFGVGGVDGTPRAFPELARQLVGHRIDESVAREMAQVALQQTEPGSDLHADAEYRRHLGAVMLTRVLLKAAQSHRISPELQC